MKKRNEKGITLISLIITIIVMLILAAVAIPQGIDTYNKTKVNKFIAKMQLVQTKVDNNYQELKGIDDKPSKFLEKYSELERAGNQEGVNSAYTMAEIGSGSNKNDFIYFTSEDMDKILDVKDLDSEETFIINFNTREVISVQGVKHKGITYYTQYEEGLPGGQKLITYEETTIKPSFGIEEEHFGLNANIVIKNIQPTNATIKYKLENEVNWSVFEKSITEEICKIPITKSGTYQIKVTDKDNNDSNIEEISINTINSPKLKAELTAKKVVGGAYSNISNSEINNGLWYNYSKAKVPTSVDITRMGFCGRRD